MIPIIPHSTPIEVAVGYDSEFTQEHLDQLEMIGIKANEVGGMVGEMAGMRRSRVEWLAPDEHRAVYQIVADLVARANAMHFRFDLSGLGEMIQVARYDDGGRYDWHQDIGAAVSRKLSVTIQLTNPTNYDGGDLEIYKSGNDALKASRARGSVSIFPSYQLHRVSPITRGTRCSLVCWVSGPPFR